MGGLAAVRAPWLRKGNLSKTKKNANGIGPKKDVSAFALPPPILVATGRWLVMGGVGPLHVHTFLTRLRDDFLWGKK